jgi:hypothetical protein
MANPPGTALLKITGLVASIVALALPFAWYHRFHVHPNMQFWSTAWPLCVGAVLLAVGLISLGLGYALTALAPSGSNATPASRQTAEAQQ